INLRTAKEKLDDYKLIAPFDGVVRKIDYMNGDNLTTDSDKYVYIENPDLLQVTVNLDQVDIAKVKVGTKATVTFDAYSTENVSAVITAIDTAPVTTSGVTSYKVTLILDDKNFKETVLSGMTGDVELIVAEKTNVLLVSTSAITTENNKSYVNIEKNGKIVKTEVVTGLAVSGKTEIISGLSLGDKISITDYTATTTSTTTTSTSLLNLGGSKSSSSKSSSSSSSMQGPPGGF
ncbi:MAG: efflux RND transporter periplasmic adaptor subunit, partial [Candidatus Gracilibacteria bacterium]|nr:efflux RND transporter periplasmic adaptor subunit [Candidatus Gracilibacteria bacterium]